jgi:TolA-binding protein
MAMSGGFWDLVNTPGQTPQQQAKPTLAQGTKSVVTMVDGKPTVVRVEDDSGTGAGSALAGQAGPNTHQVAQAPLSSLPAPALDENSPYHTMPAKDVYGQAWKQYLAGDYKNAYDALNYLSTNRPKDFATLGSPGALLFKRLQVTTY